MPLKVLVVVVLAACLLFSGCGKKKNKDLQNRLPATTTQSANQQTKAESEDIFDEFYNDTSATAQKKSAASNKTASAETYSKESFNPNGRYVVQVSCVVSQNLAQNLVNRLESKGYPAYIAEVDNPTPQLTGHFKRIRIGGFDNLSNAKSFAENYLAAEGYEYWIDNKSNDNIGMGGSGLGETSTYPSSNTYQSTPATQPTQPSSYPETQPVTTPAPTPAPVTPTPTPATQPAPVQTPSAPTPSTGTNQPSKEEWGSDTTGW